MAGVRIFPVATTVLIIAVFVMFLYGASAVPHAPAVPRAAAQGTGAAIRGYGWSDTIGWIDFSCLNAGICGTNPFGMSVATDGTITGYAWSENIGWVSANAADLSGCPSAPCAATMTTTTVSGWFRAVAATQGQAGGWDGFIRLNGVSHSASTGWFAGYAWGDTNVGWVNMAYASSTFNTCTPAYSCDGDTIIYSDKSCVQTSVTTCVAPAYCSPGSSICLYPPPTPNPGPGTTGNLQVKPSLVARGATAKLYWNLTNVTDCSVTGTNGQSWTGASSTAAGRTTAPIQGRVDFTLTCTALDSSPYTESATVSMLPVFEEK